MRAGPRRNHGAAGVFGVQDFLLHRDLGHHRCALAAAAVQSLRDLVVQDLLFRDRGLFGVQDFLLHRDRGAMQAGPRYGACSLAAAAVQSLRDLFVQDLLFRDRGLGAGTSWPSALSSRTGAS